MYLYSHKIKNYEIEQNLLLEMCSDACLCYGNGRSISSINKRIHHLKVAGADASATFLLS